MASFDDLKNDYLAWTLLQNGSINLYHRTEFLNEDVSQLRKDGYVINIINCVKIATKKELLQKLGTELDFPDWWGCNLDAFNDLLSDLIIPHNTGRVMVLKQFDNIFVHAPELAWDILDIMEHNSRFFLLFGKRLITLVQTDIPDVTVKPVGANPVSWSGKERLYRRTKKS